MGTPKIITEGLERVLALILADATHLAVGTGTNEPVDIDIVLQEETNRVAVAETLQQSLSGQIRATFANSDLPTTMEEAGVFLNGSGSPNTGDMLARVLEQFTKGSADLLLVFDITVAEG